MYRPESSIQELIGIKVVPLQVSLLSLKWSIYFNCLRFNIVGNGASILHEILYMYVSVKGRLIYFSEFHFQSLTE